jgi:multiple sugar transport system permease protein
MVLIGLGPFLGALWMSLTDLHFNLPDRPGAFVGSANYQSVLQDPRFFASINRTLLFVGICVPLQLLIGVTAALFMHLTRAGRSTYFLLVPFLMASVTIGLIWRLILHGDYGPLGYAWTQLTGSSILGSGTGAFSAVCFVDIWQWTPFFLLFALLGFQSCPEALIYAARLDGASTWRIIRSVLLPRALPLLIVATTLRVMDAVKEFDKIQALTGGGPANATETLSYYTHIVTFVQGDAGRGAAMCVLSFLLLTVLLTIVLSRCKHLLR